MSKIEDFFSIETVINLTPTEKGEFYRLLEKYKNLGIILMPMKEMGEECEYELQQDFNYPGGRISKGVIKTESEWSRYFPFHQVGDCDIKQDWFKRVDSIDSRKYTTEEFAERVLNNCKNGGGMAVAAHIFRIEHIIKFYIELKKYLEKREGSKTITPMVQGWWDNIINNRTMPKDRELLKEIVPFIFKL